MGGGTEGVRWPPGCISIESIRRTEHGQEGLPFSNSLEVTARLAWTSQATGFYVRTNHLLHPSPVPGPHPSPHVATGSPPRGLDSRNLDRFRPDGTGFHPRMGCERSHGRSLSAVSSTDLLS